ncbi:MAG: L,D-transpeptidase, partial [Muribaculaceae bacterium]|nr:L,D-transpeptidase [Muribaculaceae bacterium]
MKFRAYTTLYTLGVALVLLCGCRRAHEQAQPVIESPPTEMPDTLAVEPEPEPEQAPVVLTDTDSILAAIERSADRDRYMAGILPQMARDVPEYAGKLLANEEEGFLIVDKATMKLYRYDRYGVEQERVGVAVAKPYGSKHKRRDNRTPEGYFTIEGIYDSTDWLYTDDDGNTSQVKGQFGPRFMRLRTPVSSQIGIHGTVAPWSIGGRRSHGCIRMTNENILRFAEICRPGWPVIVSPGPKDMRVNEDEGYDIPSVPVIPGRPRCKAGKPVPPVSETTGSSPDSDTLTLPDQGSTTESAAAGGETIEVESVA